MTCFEQLIMSRVDEDVREVLETRNEVSSSPRMEEGGFRLVPVVPLLPFT